MALFRFHTGGIYDSLQITVVVRNSEDLARLIRSELEFTGKKCKLSWHPYPDKDYCFDARIGWYTHIVIMTNDDIVIMANEDDEMGRPIGFLSEDL